MKTNKAMIELLRLHSKSESLSFPLSLKLSALLNSKIEEQDGAFLFIKFVIPHSDPASRFGDLSGYECAINHVHLEDFLDPLDHQNRDVLFKSGVSFANQLKEKLMSAFPQEHFRIILSYNLDEPPGCVIRFHKVRAGENWVKLDDLEGYHTEAIMVLDVIGR